VVRGASSAVELLLVDLNGRRTDVKQREMLLLPRSESSSNEMLLCGRLRSRIHPHIL
jgi:hypothetical protein